MINEWQPILAQPENGGLFVAFEELVSLVFSSIVSFLAISFLLLCFTGYLLGTSPFLSFVNQDNRATDPEADSVVEKAKYSWLLAMLLRVAMCCLTGVAVYRLSSTGHVQLAESNLFLVACLGIIPLSVALAGTLQWPRLWIVLLATVVFCVDTTLLYALFMLLVNSEIL